MKGITVLIVEDDQEVLAQYRQKLRGLGLIIVEARSVRAAIKLLRAYARQIRLVTLDMCLNKKGKPDGPEVLRAIRRLNPTLPVIAASSSVDNNNNLRELGGAEHTFPTAFGLKERVPRMILDILQEQKEDAILHR